MLKRRLCEATFKWRLECEGPLLIKNGRYTKYKGEKEDRFPDCLFMSHAGKEELDKIAGKCNDRPPDMSFFVPGTSIRGPFRALAERIIRSLLPEDAPPGLTACDPFEQDQENHSQTLGCSKRLETETNGKSKYAAACPACKLFGCAGLASRIQFTDADIEPGYRSIYRDMIGIDRFTGGVYKGSDKDGDKGGGANMLFHLLENTTFTTTITVINFELWQLGLMAYVFREFEQGLVPIGFGKSKGFGRVKGSIEEIILTYPAVHEHIEHMGSLMNIETERSNYGIEEYKAPDFSHFKAGKPTLSLYHNFEVSKADTLAFLETVAPAFNDYVSLLKTKSDHTKVSINMIDKLPSSPIKAEKFTPLSREEIYERK